MQKFHVFPYRPNRVFTASRPADVGRFISHKILESWPAVNLIKGRRCLVRPGPTFPGQLVAVYFEGDLFFNILMYRDVEGTVELQGSDGEILRLKKGQYEIEGEVDTVYGQLAVAQPPLTTMPMLTNGTILSWKNDNNGTNLEVNSEWIRLTGQSVEEAKDMGWLTAVRPDDREKIIKIRTAGVKRGETYQTLYDLRTASGKYVKVLTLTVPSCDSEGKIISWSGAAQIQP